ncbi:MAG: DUF3667 domain-containing protein, partial [Saprospiraceae bacterium]|nr:DUF3667 domain-containing protein [Saprospiraceae bacterium]
VVTKMLGEVFDWDGRAINTIKHLLVHPGRLTLDYLAGFRKKHTPPIRLYLVVSLLFFIILPIIMPTPAEPDPVSADTLATEQYSRMMFVLLPVFALFLKLLYRNRFYVEHLVFSMHVFSAMFLVFALMLSMENPADQSLIWVSIQVAVFAYMIWYCLTALHVVYQDSWWVCALKFIALVALFLPTLSGGLNLASQF